MRRLECCRPRGQGYGSGFHLGHEPGCPVRPGRRLSDSELATVRSEVPLRLPPPEAALRTWLHHRPGCPCLVCGYIDVNLDEEDDREDHAWL